MEARQQANIRVKIEPGTGQPMVDSEGRAIAHLPEGVPRVTGLGTEHLEMVSQLSTKAKLSVEDFAGILDHLPLYTKVIQQLNYAEQSNVPAETIMKQINDLFTSQEEDNENDFQKDMEKIQNGEPMAEDNEYDYNDGWLVRDDEELEEEEDGRKKKKKKEREVIHDELEYAEMVISYTKHLKKAKKLKRKTEKYRKLLGIEKPKSKHKTKKRMIKAIKMKGARLNPVIIL